MTEIIVTAQTEALLVEFARSGCRELHVRNDDIELYLSADASRAMLIGRGRSDSIPPVPRVPMETPGRAAPALQPVATANPQVTSGAVIVHAPNLGTFYGAPKPGAEAYVSVGSKVTAGAELCLIEVMKLFTAVRTEINGRIDAILVRDGDMVVAGQPLFAIVAD